MATHTPSPGFALRPVFDRRLPDATWWPENRTLSEQLGQLFALWPPEPGRIFRVLYSSPDWDDHPPFGRGAGAENLDRRLYPRQRPPHVVPARLPAAVDPCHPSRHPSRGREELLDGVTGRAGRRAWRWADQPAWDNEGCHL